MLVSSQYIAAAVRRIRDQAMPDCAMTLTHGDCAAKVTRVASTRRGEDEVQGGYSLNESVRVLALASDVPEITKGDAADLDGTFRIVTSVRRDPSLASVYIGLSDAFERASAAYRRDDRGGNVFSGTVPCAIMREPSADEFEGVEGPTSGIAVFSVYIRRADFRQFGGAKPQTGDELAFRSGEKYRVMSVDENAANNDFYSLRARQC